MVEGKKKERTEPSFHVGGGGRFKIGRFFGLGVSNGAVEGTSEGTVEEASEDTEAEGGASEHTEASAVPSSKEAKDTEDALEERRERN